MKVNGFNNSVPQKQAETVSPNFRGKGLSSDIMDFLNKDLGKFAKFLNYAGEHQGEALNILVTAFGTAIVCPMFIRFNPFSKEDKKTRAYSAWRQPISASIALIAQLTITKWFNDVFAKLASTSNKDGSAVFKRADLRTCPHERYLKQIIKLEHPEWDKKQVESAVKQRQIQIEKNAIKQERILMKDRKFEYKELLSQDYMDNTKENVIFKEYKQKYKTEIEQKFGKSVDDVGSIKLNKFLEGKLKEEAKSAGIDAAAFVEKRAVARMECEVLSEAAIKGYLRQLVGKQNSINNLTDVVKFCEEQPEKFREGIVDYIKKLEVDAAAEVKIFGKNATEEVKSAKIDEFATSILNKLNQCIEYISKNKQQTSVVKDLGNKPEEIIQNIKIKKFIKAHNADAKKVFKTMNTQIGLIVTLLTLPLTCGLLNWAYPRIMEKIMPEMVAKKKSPNVAKKEGGDK